MTADPNADVDTDIHLDIDVLIVGAGLSGIGAACRLQTRTRRTYAVLEARDAIGGTWDLFRYPGMRSDSDMFTLGYPFRPWRDRAAIADGASILRYIRETAAEYAVDRHIRFGHKVVSASWSSQAARWTVTALAGPQQRPVTATCKFLYLCTGYYDYERGHEIDVPGSDQFAGTIVHPQHWPEDLDYRGREVVVVGSGATAVTLVPALAREAAHVTMVQRSPTYIVSRPSRDRLADWLRATLPKAVAHRLARGKNIGLTVLGYALMRRWPRKAAHLLRQQTAKLLPPSIPVDPHFVPNYDPWDQRLCLVPDGDLFAALRTGRADILTDQIAEFTPKGLLLASGTHLDADLVVTATGLTMVGFGQIQLRIDDHPVDPADALIYRGMMFSDIPNLIWCVGYVNNSWTLRADLTARQACRLLNHMNRHGYAACTPRASATITAAPLRPLLSLRSGYVLRAAPHLPKQGTSGPWRFRQNYLLDAATLRLSRVAHPTLEFTHPHLHPQPK
jgi:monooxygenase